MEGIGLEPYCFRVGEVVHFFPFFWGRPFGDWPLTYSQATALVIPFFSGIDPEQMAFIILNWAFDFAGIMPPMW